MNSKKIRTSTCGGCGRSITRGAATQEYIDIFGTKSKVWIDTKEQRALCMVDFYQTGHYTDREWQAANK